VIYDRREDEFLPMFSNELRPPLNAILDCMRISHSGPADSPTSTFQLRPNRGEWLRRLSVTGAGECPFSVETLKSLQATSPRKNPPEPVVA